ncbi:unnamed protein product [Schistosoma turkestanicum]|nr:unnamed protein product [Schistosoma turkestanicum]
MYRYISDLVCFLCIIIICDFIFVKGELEFTTTEAPYSGHQKSVVSGTKSHALYLTIHLNSSASPQTCFKSIVNIEDHVNLIRSRNESKKYQEILYGIGFGFDFFKKISPHFKDTGVGNYEYRERSGKFGKMPKTGGDIFVHAKCDDHGVLFELAELIIFGIPPECVTKFEDIYGWTYRGGRDLSGFVDDSTLEEWIGRNMVDSAELSDKPDTSHVARMVGSEKFGAEKKYRIVRQSQPYGTSSGEAGLLFIAYAANVDNFDFMLDRMTGDSEDKKNDYVMMISRCVTGNYYYFPSYEHLVDLSEID